MGRGLDIRELGIRVREKKLNIKDILYKSKI